MNQKIDSFFKPTAVIKRKKVTPPAHPVCPAPTCSETMKEFTSRSEKNNGRKYLKCPGCEVFQWRDDENWCDKAGNWCNAERSWNDYDLDRHLEVAEINRQQRIENNFKLKQEVWAMRRSGEWETLPEDQKDRYTLLLDPIQSDLAF